VPRRPPILSHFEQNELSRNSRPQAHRNAAKLAASALPGKSRPTATGWGEPHPSREKLATFKHGDVSFGCGVVSAQEANEVPQSGWREKGRKVLLRHGT
jgi:hypothetical protein